MKNCCSRTFFTAWCRYACALILLAAVIAPDLRAEEKIEDLAESVSLRSPDGRFRLVYWNEKPTGGWISGVKLKEVKTDRVVWLDPQEGREAYGGVSALWSPSGTRIALILGAKRSDTLSVLEWKGGKFLEKPLNDSEPPLKKDLGPHFYYRFDNVKVEKWIDEDTIAMVYSGKVQLREEKEPHLFKAEWVIYQYRATLSLKNGEVTFSKEGKKLEWEKE